MKKRRFAVEVQRAGGRLTPADETAAGRKCAIEAHRSGSDADKAMLQDVLRKNSKTLAVPAGSGVSERKLLDQRAASVPGDRSLSQVQGSPNGVADANPRDYTGTGSLRVSQDSDIAQPGGLERQ